MMETSADDAARTSRLLEGLRTAYEARTQGPSIPLTPVFSTSPHPGAAAPLSRFEAVLLHALMAAPILPAGHTYPTKG
ncbi:hypothetical protein [Streptomyces sp. NPDC087272]|uniref:hypothetical protein n=1 Tax=Streptomyces sp. NPDC087272 TaxID=3365775 RepID=UPI00380BF97A